MRRSSPCVRFLSFPALLAVAVAAYLLLALGLSHAQGISASTNRLEAEAIVRQRAVQGGADSTVPAGPRAIVTLNVYEGPSDTYEVVGLVPRGGALAIAGRDDSAAWIAIVFTPDSSFRGWVPAAGVTGLSNVLGLNVVAVTPLPRR